jgi:hypothetical protein
MILIVRELLIYSKKGNWKYLSSSPSSNTDNGEDLFQRTAPSSASRGAKHSQNYTKYQFACSRSLY